VVWRRRYLEPYGVQSPWLLFNIEQDPAEMFPINHSPHKELVASILADCRDAVQAHLAALGEPNGRTACPNDAPCPPFTSHGASIRHPFGAGADAVSPLGLCSGGARPGMGGADVGGAGAHRRDGDRGESADGVCCSMGRTHTRLST
jgi:hypothetical protein